MEICLSLLQGDIQITKMPLCKDVECNSVVIIMSELRLNTCSAQCCLLLQQLPEGNMVWLCGKCERLQFGKVVAMHIKVFITAILCVVSPQGRSYYISHVGLDKPRTLCYV